MSGFPPRSPAGTNSPSGHIAPDQQHKRSFSEMDPGQRFIAAIQRIARNAMKFFKGYEHLASPTHASNATPTPPATTRARNEALHNHTMRSVNFPSGASTAASHDFPYQVKYNFSSGLNTSNSAPSVEALLPQVAESLSNKQGFVYIRDDSGRNPLADFVHSFNKIGDIELGDNCKLIGAYPAQGDSSSLFSPLWIFQVHDSELETTFEVPVTEVPFNNMVDPLNRVDQLILLKDCMDTHLRALPNPYKDSVECPTIICPQLPRLAQLVTAQEECLGRQFRGELNCRERVEWIDAGEDILAFISPDLPRFVYEESADFENFFVQQNIGTIGLETLPYSIGASDIPINGASIRAFKRHLPNLEPDRSRTSASPQHPAAQAATTLNNLLNQRSQGLAYKEPLRQMQCASQAVNSLLQRHAIRAADVASYLSEKKLNLLLQVGANPADQKGLMHPKIIQALNSKQTVSISKQEFMGTDPDEICTATEQTPRESWKQIINLSPARQGKNWFDHATELNRINQIEITPNMWLAAQRGMEMGDMLDLVNMQLEQDGPAHQPRRMSQLNIANEHTQTEQLERRARHAIQQGQDFPIIVRTGAEAGHYQTIVPDRNGDWLTLNADATRQTGIQNCARWCRKGELVNSLRNQNATDILIPETPTQSA